MLQQLRELCACQHAVEDTKSSRYGRGDLVSLWTKRGYYIFGASKVTGKSTSNPATLGGLEAGSRVDSGSLRVDTERTLR